MELKSCGNTHFIRAIRGQEVVRVLNIDSRERPALVSKTLQDIYRSEEAKRVRRSPRTSTRGIHSGSVKTEAPCFPKVVRRLRECFPRDGDDMESDSDDDTTMKQFRARSKKRKSNHRSRNSDHASKEEKPLEDLSDLEELIINLKAQKSKKSKAKKKRIAKSVASSSSSSLTVKSEVIDVSENSLGFGEVAPDVSVKTEFQEADELEVHIKTSVVDDSFLDNKEELSFDDASNSQDDYTEQPIICATNEMSYSHLEEADELEVHIKTSVVDDSFLDNKEELSFDDASNSQDDYTEQPIICATNEMSYSHLEEADELEVHIKTSVVDDSFLDNKEELSFDDASNSQDDYTEQPIICATNEMSYSHLEEADELEVHIKTSVVDDSFLDNKEELSFDDASNSQDDYTEQPIICATNEMSYSHLEESDPTSMLVLWHEMDHDLETEELDSDEYQNPHSVLVPWHGVNVDSETNEFDSDEYQNPHSVLVPWHGVNVDAETHEYDSEEYQNPHPLAIEYVNETFVDQDPCFSSHMLDENISSGEQVLDISMGLPHEQDDSLSSHDQGYGSSQKSTLYRKSGETLVSMEHITDAKEQPSFCTLDGIKSNSLNNGITHMEDLASPIIGVETQSSNKSQHFGIKSNSLNNGDTHMQDSASPIIGVETQSSIKNQHFDNARILSSPEPCPIPEKLLLKRKVISPSSREQLRLAMNAKEHCSDVDQYTALKCKEKLFVKQTGKKASYFRSDNLLAKITINGARGHFSQSNNVRYTMKKSQNGKGNYEGIRPRTLPKLTTACNSIEGCSENAIEFSQRQMHDMENIAVNLMNELNSMREVVEQKLLFTAYRSVPLKNDADEVKSAIFKATKAEETARKWLTVMSRDCNRFCKIMKMTPQSGVGSEDTARNGTKKIMFADEVGEELCRVKNFQYGENSPMTDEVKQGLNST